MARPSQEDMIGEAARFGIALGADADHGAALALSWYREIAGSSFFWPNAIKIVRRIDKGYPNAAE
jgi:hypothetical protein